ncbi:TPA: PTS sugar transporter subunit IIA [Streptococcus suis]
MLGDKTIKILYDIVIKEIHQVPYLIEKFSLSRRQFAYIIEKINAEFANDDEEKLKIENDVISTPLGFLDARRKYFKSYLHQDSMIITGQNRQDLLLFLLCQGKDYNPLDDAMEIIESSRSTTLSELNILKDRLSRRSIFIRYNRDRGYYIVGDEQEIRYLVIEKILHHVHSANGVDIISFFFKKRSTEDHGEIERFIQQLLEKYDLQIFGDRLRELTVGFSILLPRLLKFENFLLDDRVIDQSSSSYKFTRELCSSYGIYQYNNINYVYYWVKGLSSTSDLSNKESKVIVPLLTSFLRSFEAVSGVRVSTDSPLYMTLYHHFQSSYYRVMFKFPIVNPLLEMIQDDYFGLYNIVALSTNLSSGTYFKQISKDELAFLTIHLLVSFTELQKNSSVYRRCLIICPHGVGTSAFIQKELSKLFKGIDFYLPGQLEEDDLSKIDFIVSTVLDETIEKYDKPYIVVDPYMIYKRSKDLEKNIGQLIQPKSWDGINIEDILSIVRSHVSLNQFLDIQQSLIKYQIQSDEMNKEMEELPLLSQLITPNLVTLQIQASDWESAVYQTALPLITYGKVTESYVNEMIQTVKDLGPYVVITKSVALPHARPEAGAKELAISVGVLQSPVNFGNRENDPVKYVFGLSALDSHTHLEAMSELVELLEEDKFYHLLDSAGTAEEIVDYIKEYEQRRVL